MAFVAPRLVSVPGVMALRATDQGVLAVELGEFLDLTVVAGVAVLCQGLQVGKTFNGCVGIQVTLQAGLEVGAVRLAMASSALGNNLLPIASGLPGVEGLMTLGTVQLMLATAITNIREDRHVTLGAVKSSQRLDRLLVDAGDLIGGSGMHQRSSSDERAAPRNQQYD